MMPMIVDQAAFKASKVWFNYVVASTLHAADKASPMSSKIEGNCICIHERQILSARGGL